MSNDSEVQLTIRAIALCTMIAVISVCGITEHKKTVRVAFENGYAKNDTKTEITEYSDSWVKVDNAKA